MKKKSSILYSINNGIFYYLQENYDTYSMDLLKDSICPISYVEFVLKYNVRLSNFAFYLFYDLKFGKCIRNISFFIKKKIQNALRQLMIFSTEFKSF